MTESLIWDASAADTLMLSAEVGPHTSCGLCKYCPPHFVLCLQVFREQGAHESSFLALQKAASLPGAPADLLSRLQEAAAACLQHGGGCGQVISWVQAWLAAAEANLFKLPQGAASQAHSVLGVKAGACPAKVRSAFRQAARKWHPDKWAAASR